MGGGGGGGALCFVGAPHHEGMHYFTPYPQFLKFDVIYDYYVP